MEPQCGSFGQTYYKNKEREKGVDIKLNKLFYFIKHPQLFKKHTHKVK